MALQVEGVVDGGVHAEKSLCGARRLEPLHFAFASPRQGQVERKSQQVRDRTHGLQQRVRRTSVSRGWRGGSFSSSRCDEERDQNGSGRGEVFPVRGRAQPRAAAGVFLFIDGKNLSSAIPAASNCAGTSCRSFSPYLGATRIGKTEKLTD